MKHFLIIRLSSLGDIIHTLPAFSALRKKFPQARISWMVEEKGQEILDLVAGLDRTIILHPSEWGFHRRRFWSEIFRLREKTNGKKQVALDFQGLVKSALLAFLTRAPTRIGFHKKNLKEPLASLFYTEALKEIPEDIHVISKNLRLLSQVGIQEENYEFPLVLPEELLTSVDEKLKETGYDDRKKLVLLNVGAGWESKRWFPEKWVDLIEKLKRPEIFPLLLWGNEYEKSLAEYIGQKTNTLLTPFLSVKEVMALVRKASLLVSGDTFALQAACAFCRPVVGIFGPTNPRRNGPFNDKAQVAFHELECSYCYKRSCSHLECLKAITAEEVARMSLRVLERNV
jgi:heptosyltransferase-1